MAEWATAAAAAGNGRQWNWQVRDALQPWEAITKGHVDAAEQRIARSVTSFRAQIISGRLYVTDIRALWFARQFTASAKLTLLAVLRNFRGEIPDLDIVVNQGDYPVVLMPKTCEVRQYYLRLLVKHGTHVASLLM